VLDFLKLVLPKDGGFKVDLEDDIVAACLMTHEGTVSANETCARLLPVLAAALLAGCAVVLRGRAAGRARAVAAAAGRLGRLGIGRRGVPGRGRPPAALADARDRPARRRPAMAGRGAGAGQPVQRSAQPLPVEHALHRPRAACRW
jgi:hypothetical protein